MPFFFRRLLTTIALPFGLIMFFNVKIFSYYKENSLQTGHDGSLLAIFGCITFTFLLCHFPRVILNVYEFHLHKLVSLPVRFSSM